MNCFKRSFLVIVLLAFVNFPTFAQQAFSAQESFQKSSLSQNSTAAYNPSALHLGAQFGSGLLLGAVGGAVGFLGGAIVSPKVDGPGGLITLGYAAGGAYIGYSLSSALGVYMVANTKSYNASLRNILLGHAIGMGLGFGTFALSDSPAVFAIALTAPLIGGMIANSKSIQKRSSKKTALLNLSDGHTTLSAPSVQLTNVGNYDMPKNQSATVKLLNISL